MKIILFFPKKTFCAIFLKPIIISGFFILMSNISFAFLNENKSCELELIKNSSVEIFFFLRIPILPILMKIALNGQEEEKDVTQEKVKGTEEIDFAEQEDKLKNY